MKMRFNTNDDLTKLMIQFQIGPEIALFVIMKYFKCISLIKKSHYRCPFSRYFF